MSPSPQTELYYMWTQIECAVSVSWATFCRLYIYPCLSLQMYGFLVAIVRKGGKEDKKNDGDQHTEPYLTVTLTHT